MTFMMWSPGRDTRLARNRSNRPSATPQAAPSRRLLLEALEARLAPATYTWNNASGGSWHTSTNWTPTGVPGASDNVDIPALGTNLAITFSTGSVTVANVTLASRASGSTSLSLNGGTLTVTGEITTGTNAQVVLNGATLANATLTNGSRLAMSGRSGNRLDGVTISTGATLDGSQNIDGWGASTTNVRNGLTVNGQVLLGGTGTGAIYGRLFFEGTQTLSGTGSVTFGTNANNGVYAEALGVGTTTLTIGSGITIQGMKGVIQGYYSDPGSTWMDRVVNLGQITVSSGGQFTLGGVDWQNQGAITALSGSSVKLVGRFASADLGNFTATGATVWLAGTLSNAASTLQLKPSWGGNWILDGGTIQGGTIAGSGNGERLILTNNSNNKLDGVTIAAGAILDGTNDPNDYGITRVTVTNGLTVNGQFLVGGTGTGADQAYYRFQGTQTLGGTGTVIFGTNANNVIYVESITSQVPTTLTIGSGITVQGGKGQFGTWYGNTANYPERLINQGTINVTAGGSFEFSGNVGWTNTGTISAVAGSTLKLGGTFEQADIGTLTATGAEVRVTGTLNNASSTLQLKPSWGGNWILDGGTIQGGTIAGSGNGERLILTNHNSNKFDGVTIAAGVVLDGTNDPNGNNATRVTVTNGLTLNGQWLAGGTGTGADQAYYRFQGTQTLGGTGTVIFGTNANNVIYVESITSQVPTTLTIGSGITVQGGKGQFGTWYGNTANYPERLINQGTINVTAGGSFEFSGNVGWTNTGTISAVAGSTLHLGGTFTRDAIGTLTATGADVRVTGTLNNANGTLQLKPTWGGNWILDGGTIQGGTIAGSGNGERLILSNHNSNKFDGVTIAAGVVLDGTNDPNGYNATRLIVTNGLTLNGQWLAGGTGTGADQAYYRFQGTQTLGGTGSMIFGTNASNAVWVEATYQVLATLTIGSDITVQVGKGLFGAWNGNTTNYPERLINQGTISVAAGGTFEFSSNLGWTNTGTIFAASGSAVTLGGSFTTAGIGNFTATGATVYLSGVLDNTNDALQLKPAWGGDWILAAGTITGGTITSANGAKLVINTNASNRLSGVTLASSVIVDATRSWPATTNVLYVSGGMTLYGTINLGNTGGSTAGRLFFQGTQTLGGTGTILFGGSTSNGVYSSVDYNTSGSLTIGPGITIQGGSGAIRDDNINFSGTESILNQGTILGGTTGTLTIGGGASINAGLISQNGGTITLVGTSFTNQPGGLMSGAGTFNTGSVSLIDNGITDRTTPSIINVVARYDASTITIRYNAAAGMNAASVSNPANYVILGSGGDGLFGNGNDVNRASFITGVTYDPGTLTATLQLSGPLPLDSYRIGASGTLVTNSSGVQLRTTGDEVVNRVISDLLSEVSLSLDPASDSGGSSTDRVTNDNTPTFRIIVNQPGTIGIDYTSTGTYTATLFAPTAGTYYLTAPNLPDGSYTASATFTSLAGSIGTRTLNYTIDTAGPRVVSMTPTGTVNRTVADVTLVMSEPIDLTTLPPSAFTLMGPQGPVVIQNWNVYHISGSTYRLSFARQFALGEYTLTAVATIADPAGNRMNQNQNGVNGEAGVDAFNGSFTIALPDLEVTTATAPAVVVAGGSVPVSWTVKNVGNAVTSSNWYDTVYLAYGVPNLETALGNWASTPLTVNATYTRNQSITIPANTEPGSGYFLVFVANNNDAQEEPADWPGVNNMYVVEITVTAPDLRVSTVGGPVEGYSGQRVVVSWTVTNDGDVPASGTWIDRVAISASSTGSNPTTIGNFTFEGTIAPGQSVVRTQEVILPPNISGLHWLTVTTNVDQAIADANPANDVAVASNSIDVLEVPLPDLVVSSITPPQNGTFSGTTVPISFMITNQGEAPTSVPSWRDWVIVSQDGTLGDSYLGQMNWTGPGGDEILSQQPIVVGAENPAYLGVGETYQQTVYVTLPIDAQGTWYVYVIPDGTGARHPFAMPQISRTNKLLRSSAFSVTLSPPPDLVASNVITPLQNFSGMPMSISWTVTNEGDGPTYGNRWTDSVYMSTSETFDESAVLLKKFPRQGILPAGDSYTRQESVTLPVGIQGQYYFFVKTDAEVQVFENGLVGNNVARTASARTVNLTPPPDLEVWEINAPTNARAGRPFTFSYTVFNLGGSATPNYSWYDAIYLSPTSNFDPNTAVSLGSRSHQGGLNVDESYTETVTTTLPLNLTGTWYIHVRTDAGSDVFEFSDTNNGTSSTQPVQVVLTPSDLVVTSIEAPSTVLAGSTLRVTWTVANQSEFDSTVESWVDRIYVDYGTSLSPTAILLGSATRYGLLEANGSYTRSLVVTVPLSLEGNLRLWVVTNAAEQVPETSLTNNSSWLPLTVEVTSGGGGGETAPISDLQVVSVSNSSVVNGRLTVNWIVSNAGGGATNATFWNDDVWLSSVPTLDGSAVYLGTVQRTNPLASGSNYSASASFSIPSYVSLGDYYIIVATDRPLATPDDPANQYINRVYESNETNNTRATALPTPVPPAPVRDLTVANVQAAATATAGATLPVSWVVTNTGDATGNVSIIDAVYLSFDRIFDRYTDLYLGSVTHFGGLGSNASYNGAGPLDLPAGVAGTFYVIVVTNPRGVVPETNTANNVAISTQPVEIDLPPAANLVAGTVTIPSGGLAGQSISITYTVTNQGSSPAVGTWTDSLYLSPTRGWNPTNPFLGRITQSHNIAPNGTYQGELNTALPGVAPGLYYVIVRTNVRNNLQETILADNLSASLNRVEIDAQALTLGVPTEGTMVEGQQVYYKVEVPAGETLRIRLNSDQAEAANELYVSFGTMPTRSRYDARYSKPFEPNQVITIPTTRAGTYYILAYADRVPTSSEGYSLLAELVPFSVQAVSPGEVGNGPVTLEVSGAKFDFDTTFRLRKPDGNFIPATRTLLQNSASAFVTFNLEGQPLGTYSVQAIQGGGAVVELTGGLTVEPALPNSLEYGLVLPRGIFVGRPGNLTISYANRGNTDLPAPLLVLEGVNALFQIPGQTAYTREKLQLIGLNSAGPFGTLPPGFEGTINISFRPIVEGAGEVSTFRLKILEDASEPFDWNGVLTNQLPLNTSPQQWSRMVEQARPLLGDTWGEVVSFLGNNTIQLVKNADGNTDPAARNSLYDFNGLLQYAIGIYGTNHSVGTEPNLPLVGSLGEVKLYNANLNNGLPTALNAAWPTVILVGGWNGYRPELGDLAQAIVSATDCFPSGQVNVLIATWTGATAGPELAGLLTPWTAALHIDTAGTQLGELLLSLNRDGDINFTTTTLVGDGFGSYLGYQAARITNGLNHLIALNPPSPRAGYIPPLFSDYFAHSVAYETSSLFGLQLAVAESNQTLDTGDLNNPVLQQLHGVPWLTQQILAGNCELLAPGSFGPDVIPPANTPWPASCPRTIVVSNGTVVQIAAIDPNSIIGPTGSGSNQIVPVSRVMNYTVYFANDSNAQAPAQQIVVTLQLDPELDWRTFRLVSFVLSGREFSIPSNTAFYQTVVDLMPGYAIEFTGSVNLNTGLVTWVFTTINTSTGEMPTDPTIGLLPPNNLSGIGEGSVTYSVLPKRTAEEEALVTAMASIIFDVQPSLETNEHFNTLGSPGALTSWTQSPSGFINTTQFEVRWDGSDSSKGAGVRDFTVYVSDNGGPYTVWQAHTTLRSAIYNGVSGHTYRFITVATDYAGNRQTMPVEPQSTTTIDLQPPTSRVTSLANFSTSSFTVSWEGTDGTGSGLASYTIYVSVNNGPYSIWLENTTVTSAQYTGTNGNTYRFYSRAVDQLGNREATPASPDAITTVDTQPPTSQVTTLPSYSGTSFTVQWTGNDGSGVGIVSYTLYVSTNGVDFSIWLPATAQTSAQFTGTSGTTYYFYSVAVDQLGNREATPALADTSTTVDTAPPSSAVATLPGYSPGTFTVQWSGSDTGGSGLSSYTLYVSINNAPFTPWIANTTTTSAQFTGTNGNSYRFYSRAVDLAGNQEATPTDPDTFTSVDTLPPSSQVSLLPDFTNQSTFLVQWSGNDPDGSGIASYTLYVSVNDGPYSVWIANTTTTSAQFTGTNGNSYRFYSRAVDLAGNQETTPTDPDASTTVDTAPPTSAVTTLPGYSPGTFTVQWSGSDGAGSSISTYTLYVSVNDGPYSVWLENTSDTSAQFTGTNGNSYRFYSRAIDNAGNLEAAPINPDTFTTVDTLPPSSQVSLLPDFTNQSTFLVQWAGNDPDGSGIASYTLYVSVNDGPYSVWIANTTTTSAQFTGTNGNSYRFYSVAVDLAGNQEATPTDPDASTTVDTAPPTSAVTTLPGYSPGTFTVQWSGSDGAGSGIATYTLYVSIDNEPYSVWLENTSATSAQFSAGFGNYLRFYSVAVDHLGNQELAPTSPDATTTIDTQNPTSEITDLLEFSPGSFTVQWTGSDTGGAGLASYTLYVSVNDGPFTPWIANTTTTSAQFTGTNGNSYRFYSVAVDLAGNQEAAPTDPDTFTTVDTQAPSSQVIAPTYSAATTFTVQWAGDDDNGSGLASYNIFVSINNQPFELWLGGTTATSAQYNGTHGNSYRFYSRAIDQLGNLEATPAEPDAATLIDTEAPTSDVLPLATLSSAPSFLVSWNGSDSDSGVSLYEIYISIDGQSPELWHSDSNASSRVYTGEVGHTYTFYTLATDRAGNLQPSAATPRSTTILSPTLTLRREGETVELVDSTSGQVFLSQLLTDPTPLVITGSNDLEDVLTINYVQGGAFALPGGLWFDAGSGTGDRFRVIGAGTGEVIVPTGSMQTVSLPGMTATFTGLDAQDYLNLTLLRITTSGGNDAFTAAGNLLTGTALVPLTLSGVRNLEIDLGSSDTTTSVNSLTVNGAWTATGLTTVKVLGGAGRDTLTNNTAVLLLPGKGTYSFLGGTGIDRIEGNGNVNWTLSNAALTSNRGGRVSLSSVEEARLIGGTSPNILNASAFTGTTWLTGGRGNDTFRGGKGFDWLVESGNTNFTLTNSRLTGGLGVDTLSSINGARLTGGTGNNTLDARQFGGRTQLDGAAGNDVLRAGPGASILLGGTGNDTLFGGNGRDLLIGGVGVDTFNGGNNEDLLINGTTAFDENWDALAAVLAEWSRTDRSYTQRIAALRIGGGRNGNLTLTSATVFDDTSVDRLRGGASRDWFWRKLTPGAVDSLLDRQTGETSN